MNRRVGNSGDAVAERPEPDGLDGFPHPRRQVAFHGHEQALHELVSACGSGKLHHAWLFLGPAGVGKGTLAYRLARTILSRTGDAAVVPDPRLEVPPEGAVSRQVAALSHPNLLVLRRPWQERGGRLASEITVGEVRRLRSFFARTAHGDAWRVVIIDRAEELNAAAANALLKSLEEPPKNCIFLLVCSAPGRLPVTIRSRCRLLRFGALGDDDLRAVINDAYEGGELQMPDAAMIDAILPLAQGSAERALRLLDGGGVELRDKLMTLLAGLPNVDQNALHALADELSVQSASNAFDLFFELTCDALARIVSQAATGSGAVGEEAKISSRLKSIDGLAIFAGLWETVRRAKAEADALNLDRKNLVLVTFFRLEKAAREAFA